MSLYYIITDIDEVDIRIYESDKSDLLAFLVWCTLYYEKQFFCPCEIWEDSTVTVILVTNQDEDEKYISFQFMWISCKLSIICALSCLEVDIKTSSKMLHVTARNF